MKRTLVFAFIVLFALSVGACGAAATPAPTARSAPPSQPSEATDQSSAMFNAQPNAQGKSSPYSPADGSGSASTASAADRLIIKTASLSLTVKDAEAALEAVKTTAAALGGFVSNSQSTRVADDRVRVSVTIRVPADKFDEALKQIKQAGIRVNTEKIGGQDVTEEYTDLGARLRNLEATERELLALMTTVRERTNKAEEILAVQRELNNVRQQIEQIKGRMQYLDRSVALATITLDLVPEALEGPVTEPVWDPARVARDAFRSLTNMLQGLANVGIYLVILVLPVLIMFGLPLVAVARWLWRRPRGAKPIATR